MFFARLSLFASFFFFLTPDFSGVNERTEDGFTSFSLACYLDKEEMAHQILASRGFNTLNFAKHLTALWSACHARYARLTRDILTNPHLNQDGLNKAGDVRYSFAGCSSGWLMSPLYSQGKTTPLLLACKQQWADVASLILNHPMFSVAHLNDPDSVCSSCHCVSVFLFHSCVLERTEGRDAHFCGSAS